MKVYLDRGIELPRPQAPTELRGESGQTGIRDPTTPCASPRTKERQLRTRQGMTGHQLRGSVCTECKAVRVGLSCLETEMEPSFAFL